MKRIGPDRGAPLFIVGAPRSGTSLLYRILCMHPEASYVSNWVRRFPSEPATARANRVARRARAARKRYWFDGSNAYVYGRARSPMRRAFPAPVEGLPFFAGCGVGEAGLQDDGVALVAAVDTITRSSGGPVFVSKCVANNRWIGQLETAFPDARFLEIVRDGRAVACSLSRVDWWADSTPWWSDLTPREWEQAGGDPWELCARAWVEEVELLDAARELVPSDRWRRVRYEVLVEQPLPSLKAAAAFAGLRPSATWVNDIERIELPDRNEAWRSAMDPRAITTVETIQAATLRRLGYAVDAAPQALR